MGSAYEWIGYVVKIWIHFYHYKLKLKYKDRHIRFLNYNMGYGLGRLDSIYSPLVPETGDRFIDAWDQYLIDKETKSEKEMEEKRDEIMSGLYLLH